MALKKPRPLDDNDDNEDGLSEGGDDALEERGVGEEDEIDVDRPDPDDSKAAKKAAREEAEARENARDERIRAAEERAARAEGAVQAMHAQRQAPVGPVVDETEAKISELTKQRASKLSLIRQAVGNDEATNALASESMQLEGEIQRLRTRQAIEEYNRNNRPESPNVQMQILQSETPAVYEQPNMKAYAQGEYMRRVARGAPPTIETARAANQQTLRDFGMARGPAPTASAGQRSVVGGMPTGGGAPSPTGKVKLSRSLRKIGRAAASVMGKDDDEATTDRKFAKRLRKGGIA